jgi:quercetin dioxygenase-like cupin family protein
MSACIAAAGVAAVAIGLAQQSGFKRTEVQRADLSMPGREVVAVVAEIPSGGSSGRHTHPGEEVGYMLEGTMILEVAGKAPMTVKAGQGFVVPAGQPHSATNTASPLARVLATYIIEKGKPIATPAP